MTTGGGCHRRFLDGSERGACLMLVRGPYRHRYGPDVDTGFVMMTSTPWQRVVGHIPACASDR